MVCLNVQPPESFPIHHSSRQHNPKRNKQTNTPK
jgi:hypothetical protein